MNSSNRGDEGSAALVLACLLMAASVRSLSYSDFASLLRGDKQLLREFGSSRMGLSYVVYFQDFSQSPYTTLSFATQTWKFEPGVDLFTRAEMKWSIDCCGFRCGDNSRRRPNPESWTEAYIVPHWSIVIPLILISAWLLLSKLRPKQNSTQPAA